MTLDVFKRETTAPGVTGALPYDPVQYCVLAGATAIAWAYTIELDLLVIYTFRRRSGLYFWSLLISSWGCSLHALGFILKFLVGASWLLYLPFVEIGWVCMVTGQAFVLWSRLHLVVRKQRTLRLVLAMIIFDALILHIPTIVFTYGSNSPNPGRWTSLFSVYERMQLTWFSVQEFIISTVYISATVKLLGSIYHSMTRTVMLQLVIINCICIGMDVVLIALEFTNDYVGEAALKGMIYAIKLKLEFAVLNQLMSLTRAGLTEATNIPEESTGPNGSIHHIELQHSKRRGTGQSSDVETPNAPTPRNRKESLRTWLPFGAKQLRHQQKRRSMRLPDDATTNLGLAIHHEQIVRTQEVDVTTAPRYSASIYPVATAAASGDASSDSSESHLRASEPPHAPDSGVRHFHDYSMKDRALLP